MHCVGVSPFLRFVHIDGCPYLVSSAFPSILRFFRICCRLSCISSAFPGFCASSAARTVACEGQVDCAVWFKRCRPVLPCASPVFRHFFAPYILHFVRTSYYCIMSVLQFARTSPFLRVICVSPLLFYVSSYLCPCSVSSTVRRFSFVSSALLVVRV